MLRRIAKSVFGRMGYEVRKKSEFAFAGQSFMPDLETEKEFKEIYERCKDYTMISIEGMYSLYKATEYIVKNEIPGDMVECGVWKGGSSMMMALTLMRMNETKRCIYLYDTYRGMSKPTERDISYTNESAGEIWRLRQKESFNEWNYISIEEVKGNLFSTAYPKEKLIFVKGKVEDTIPNIIPDKIAVLRLDTDWYESTYHELRHLFPRLSADGVIILDDYGTWKGAREAADKYFKENKIKILLNRIDCTERVGIKAYR